MLLVDTLALGAYQTNCYLVRAEGSTGCCVLDPGDQPETVFRALKARNLTVDAVLLTHGHFDHVGAVEALADETGCPVWISRADWDLPSSPLTARFYPLAGRQLPGLRFCREDTPITAGGTVFIVLATPGHTPGSVCYRAENALFSGDTLFAGSCGRTDLPGGDPQQMGASLARLVALPGDADVYPGHGETTALARERRENPYLRQEATPWN